MKNKKLSISLKAYTAGFLDGEGSITIRATQNGYWAPTVQISNGDLDVLKNLWSRWGKIGTITHWHPRGSRLNRRSYNWRLWSKQSEFLLRNILPYLQIKKENAKIVLQFKKYIGYGRNTLTKKMIVRRKNLALQIHRLNERYGKRVEPKRNYSKIK